MTTRSLTPVRFKLPPQGALQPIDQDDPMPYYYKPFIGGLYRARLDIGLRDLPARSKSILEVGYGSGILMPTLFPLCQELVGVDIHQKNEEVRHALLGLGVTANLLSQDARRLPFDDARFDIVLSFSFMEHVKPADLFLSEMWRVLRPGGRMFIGMPMVNKIFNTFFQVIGYSGIENHHVTSPSEVIECFIRNRWSWQETGLPSIFPSALRIYRIFKLLKKAP